MKAAQEWLKSRTKVKPNEAEADAPGVDAMRALIAEEMKERGVLMNPKLKPGRPTRQQSEDRRLYLEVAEPEKAKEAAADDSRLKRLLSKTTAVPGDAEGEFE